MVSLAPIPMNEIARLASLQSYRILDTGPDERFDLFTRLGTWLFGAPVCGIHFVGSDTTFFKSLIGVETYKPSRDTSICAHAVGLDEPIMTVEDLAQDPRFCDHPLTVKRGLRFYAGAILRSSSQHALGTYCIADVVPRILSDDERQKLTALANGVVNVLELHRCGLQLLDDINRDGLTGLYNRRHFETALRCAVDRADAGSPFALIFLDLDHFKSVNDTMGHAAGDAVLCEVGRRLGLATRSNDVVARLAGDEFVLLASVTDTAAVSHLATRILATIALPFAIGGRPIDLRCSIGITLYPGPTDPERAEDQPAVTDHALLRQADIALYQAKQNGRHCFSLYRAPSEQPGS